MTNKRFIAGGRRGGQRGSTANLLAGSPPPILPLARRPRPAVRRAGPPGADELDRVCESPQGADRVVAAPELLGARAWFTDRAAGRSWANTLRLGNHYLPTRVVRLGLVQGLALVGSVLAAVFIASGARISVLGEQPALLSVQALLFAALMLLSMVAMGVYKPQMRGSYRHILRRVGAGVVLGLAAWCVLYSLLPGLYPGRGVTTLAATLALGALLATQFWDQWRGEQTDASWRILFYGAGHQAAALLSQLRRRSDQRDFTLSGCVAVPGEETQVESRLIRKVGGSLLAYARLHRINEIVVVMDDRRRDFPSSELMACRMVGINIVDHLSFYERQTGKVKTELLSPHWIIFSLGFRQTRVQDVIKRGFDWIVAMFLLVLSVPIMALIVAAIRWEEGRTAPVLFSQARVGRHGKEFRIYKFRSMRVDANAEGTAQWCTDEDPRITRVGRFIRRYRLDELPQLFNVLTGEMSLVGPRPEQPAFVRQLSARFPYYHVRHQVKPGITGWAQIGYRYGASDEDANAKLQFELYYVKNRSTFLDFLVLLRTVETVLFRQGAR